MNVSNKHFRKLSVTSSDIEYLKSTFSVQTQAKSIDTIYGDLVFPKDSPVSQFTTETNFRSQADCITLEENTRGQKHRLTSSKFGAIIKRKHITTKFIDSLLNPKDFSSKQTSWGLPFSLVAHEKRFFKIKFFHVNLEQNSQQ
ncbi:hypothetical protein KUTeg_014483, partial [Tegillarca granosa]